jgi:hypothetical protein
MHHGTETMGADMVNVPWNMYSYTSVRTAVGLYKIETPLSKLLAYAISFVWIPIWYVKSQSTAKYVWITIWYGGNEERLY